MQVRRNDRIVQQFNARIESLLALLHKLREGAQEQRRIINRMIRRASNLRSVFSTLEKLENGGVAEPERKAKAVPALMTSFWVSSHTLASLSKRLSGFHAERIERIENNALMSTAGAAGFVIIAVLIVHVYGVRNVFVPLIRLRDRVRQMVPDEEVHHTNSGRPMNELEEIAFEYDRRFEALQNAESKLASYAQDLKRSNTDLEQLAYVASHDLRAPLRGIKTTASWIAEDLKDVMDDDSRENLDLLRNRIDRLDKLLDGLLQYSRVSTDSLKPEAVDVRELLDDIALLMPLPEGITVEPSGDLPKITTTPVHLQRVLLNLIDNAVKHHDRAEGLIQISAEDRGDIMELEVRDDGPGIPPEFHDKVTQLFQTLTRRDEKVASGMGLAMVKKLVERHGGTLTINSPLTDRGCAVRFGWRKDNMDHVSL